MAGLDTKAWHKKAYASGVDLTTTPGPVSFVLGAGASFTSKCPTTPAVDDALKELVLRWPGRTVREVLYRVDQVQIQSCLEPLFGNTAPYIGYLSLASLGRRRRVHVLNLNWDPMIERACEQLGVPCFSFDLNRPPSDDEIADALPADAGILIGHVHGRLGEECRYDYLTTLKLSPHEKEFVARHISNHPRVFVGISLLADFDLVEWLWHESAKAPTWFFGRDLDDAAIGDLREVLPHRAEIVISDEMDFDDLMVIIAGKVAGYRWDDFRRGRQAVALPSLSEIAWPKRTILRPFLTQRSCVLVNGTRTGKSTIAHLLAYLKTLWFEDRPSDYHVKTLKGARQTIAALSGIGTDDRGVLVLEDPFGAGRFDDNPTLVAELERVTVDAPSVSVIVTSRLDRWQDAQLPDGLPVTSREWLPRTTWYSRERLKQFARAIAPDHPELLEAIHQRQLVTPAQIADRTQGIERSPEAPVEEKLSVLEHADQLAAICALVRLARFRSAPVTREFITAQLGHDVYDIDFAGALIHTFPFEGGECLTLLHDEDIEAVDRYLKLRGVDAVAERTGDLLAVDLSDAVARWSTVQAVERGDIDAVLAAPPDVIADVAPDLVRSGWRRDELIELLNSVELDQWALLDLAYEVVRLWQLIRQSSLGHALLARILNDRTNRGAYAVLEACLYLPNTASDEIWAELENQLWHLLQDEGAAVELALAVDAFLWRPPPPSRPIKQWLVAVQQAIKTDDPRWGLWRFVAAYHPTGCAAMIDRETLNTDLALGLDEEQCVFAADLVSWHFMHQSRARASLNRAPWVDKDFLCRSTYQPREGDGAEAVERLVRSLARFPTTAPWAFHVVCNLMSNPSAAPVRREVEHVARVALSQTSGPHVGVISAALTYETAQTFSPELRDYFAAESARTAGLDALAGGIPLDGAVLVAPRFVFALPADVIHETCGFTWPALERMLGHLGPSLVTTLLAEARRRTPELIAAGHAPARVRAARIRIERGDLRHSEQGALQRGSVGSAVDPIFNLLELAVLAEPLPSAADGTLF